MSTSLLKRVTFCSSNFFTFPILLSPSLAGFYKLVIQLWGSVLFYATWEILTWVLHCPDWMGRMNSVLLQACFLIWFLFSWTWSVYFFSRTREKKRDDGKWRDYDRYYDRSDLYREKSSWRRGRSKSRSKSRGLSRSRSRSRGRSKDRDANRSAGEYPRCCSRRTSNVSDVWWLPHAGRSTRL